MTDQKQSKNSQIKNTPHDENQTIDHSWSGNYSAYFLYQVSSLLGRVTQDLAVYTQYDVTINFNDYKTFSMPNTVVYIDEKTSTLNNANATALLNRMQLT